MSTPIVNGRNCSIVTVDFAEMVTNREAEDTKIEEKLLIKEFENEYLEYKKHTKALVPYIYCKTD